MTYGLKRADLIVSGYIRELDNDLFSGHFIPIDIFQVCIEFFPKLDNIRFSVCNKALANYICLEDGDQILESTLSNTQQQYRIFASDEGFDTGYHIWKLRMIADGVNKYGGIGVCTTPESILIPRSWLGITHKSMGVVYYWSHYHGKVTFCDHGQRNEVTQNWDIAKVSWLKNDTITVILDCENWTLEYLLNSKSAFGKPIDIKPNKYYPALSFYTHHDKYQVLTM